MFMNEGEKFDWLQQRLNVLETKQQYSSRKHAMCGHASGGGGSATEEHVNKIAVQPNHIIGHNN